MDLREFVIKKPVKDPTPYDVENIKKGFEKVGCTFAGEIGQLAHPEAKVLQQQKLEQKIKDKIEKLKYKRRVLVIKIKDHADWVEKIKMMNHVINRNVSRLNRLNDELKNLDAKLSDAESSLKSIKANIETLQKKKVKSKETRSLMRFRMDAWTQNKQAVNLGLTPEVVLASSSSGAVGTKLFIAMVDGNGSVLMLKDMYFHTYNETLRKHKVGYFYTLPEEAVILMNERLPHVLNNIEELTKVTLNQKEQIEFATNALVDRYRKELTDPITDEVDKDKLNTQFNPVELLTGLGVEEAIANNKDITPDNIPDVGNVKDASLWNVYRTVHVNLTTGNYYHYDGEKAIKARGLSQIRLTLIMNDQLWNQVDSMVNISEFN